MNTEQREHLKSIGRNDLIIIHDATQAGYAGMLPGSGQIVDRRHYPNAVPVPKNELLGIPEPKEVEFMRRECSCCKTETMQVVEHYHPDDETSDEVWKCTVCRENTAFAS